MTAYRNPDGTLTPATPLPTSTTLDAEVTGTSPYTWTAWRGTRRVDSGTARTRLGLAIALLRVRMTKKDGRR
jgi:hypothetical protein